MTCKDCLHYEACTTSDGYICETFSDKSEWVHLPCKKGDKVYWLNGIEIQEYEVEGFLDADELGWRVVLRDFSPIIGHTELFFSKEEAEKELAERNKEK